MKYIIALSLMFAVTVTKAEAGAAAKPFKVTEKKILAGDQGWDYLTLDSDSRRLYISRGDHIAIVDADSLNPLGEIKDTNGVHGVALAAELKRGFTSNGKSSTVTIFDLDSTKTLSVVKTGDRPDAIVYEPTTQQVFTFNGASHDSTVIDAKTGTVSATIALGGKPEFAVVDGHGMIFNNIEDKNQLVEIDAKAKKIVRTYSLAPCESPSGLAIDTASKRLFAVCENKILVVVNADTGKVIKTLPIGAGADAAGFDPSEKLIFSSNGGDGNLTVIKEEAADKYSVVQVVSTQKGARTLALDQKTHRIVLVTADFGAIPKPSKENPHARAPILPGTVVALVVDRK